MSRCLQNKISYKGHNEPTKLISAQLLDLPFVPLKHSVLVLLSTKIISFQMQILHTICIPGDEGWTVPLPLIFMRDTGSTSLPEPAAPMAECSNS